MSPERTRAPDLTTDAPGVTLCVTTTRCECTRLARMTLNGGTLAGHEGATQGDVSGGDQPTVRPAHNPATDRQVAEHALTILARKRSKMPLTAGFMQAVAQQGFGHAVGMRRAATMVEHLRSNGSLVQVGRYRGKRHGFWVPIYRITGRSALCIASVRRNPAVKGGAWWQHGLFGNPDGEKPLYAAKKDLRRWRSKPHRALELARANASYPAAPLRDLNVWEGTL